MEPRISDSGYKRKHNKVCDVCGSSDLNYLIKGWIKCDSCDRLYSRKHKFNTEVE